MATTIPGPISQLPQTTGRDPLGLLPISALVPLTTFGEKLADLLGNYTGFTSGVRPLNAAQTAGLPTSSLGLLISLVNTGQDLYPMVLGAGNSPTNAPLVVQPADFSTSNQAVYTLVNVHAKAVYVEGISGFGFVSLPQQFTPVSNPISGARIWCDANNVVWVSTPTGSHTI